MYKYKNLISNFLSLSVLQGLNYILPLLTLPYLVRVLGVENFGLIAFSQSVIQIFILFTDYGFNLSATKQIALNRENKNQVYKIFSSVITIKFLLSIIGLLMLFIILLTVDKFNKHWMIYLVTYITVFGNSLFPIWFFLGIEKMKYITFINVISKGITTILIFILVNGKQDVIILAFINSLGFIIASVLSLIFIFTKLKVRYIFPNYSEIVFQLKDGWYVFLSLLSTSIYTSIGLVILGLYYNSTIVGYFAAIDKILNAVKGLYQPLAQALFPYINKLAQNSRYETVNFLKKITVIVGTCEIIICFFLFFFSEFIVISLFGQDMLPSVMILKIMSLIPLIVSLSSIIGSQTLLVFNFKKLFSMSIIIPSVIHMVLVCIFVPKFGLTSLAITVVVTELFILIYRIVGLKTVYNKIFEEEVCGV